MRLISPFLWMLAAAGLAPALCAQQVQWQTNFPDGSACLKSVRQTPDGGYILAGYTNFRARAEGWVVRTDANGGKLWDRSFGTTNHDNLLAVAPVASGGFILAGGINNTRFGSPFAAPATGGDGWVLRLDDDGNVLWQQTFGGSSNDVFCAVVPLSDGGFLAAGSSDSPGNDGNKTSPNWGGSDFWIVRLDADGNKLWERSYGGNWNEYLYSLDTTLDGGFVIGGDVNGALYASGWLLRLDGEGNVLWQYSPPGIYGGAPGRVRSVAHTAEGGCLIAGWAEYAYSAITYEYAFYVLRLNASGNQMWLQQYYWWQGNSLPRTREAQVRETADGGYLLAGTPGISGGTVRMMRGDASGHTLWEQTNALPQNVGWITTLEVTRDRGFVLGAFLDTGFWIMKLASDLPTLSILPRNFAAAGQRLVVDPVVPGTFVIERSGNLQQWEPWQTNQLTAPAEIPDPSPAYSPAGFYRIKRVP